MVKLSGNSRKKVLKMYKQNRKGLFSYIWHYYDKRAIMKERDETTVFGFYSKLITQLLEETQDDYNLAAEADIVMSYFANANFDLNVKELIYLTQRAFKAFHKIRYPRKVKESGGMIPHLNKTDTIWELLYRGWIHKDDAKLKHPYFVRCLIADLVWPISFKTHQDAIAENNKVGIPGRTGTVIPKK